MREIKFRGKDIEGRWFYGLLSVIKKSKHRHTPAAGTYISNESGAAYAYRVIPDTVGQYTGLKGKNGQDIYEGDFIACSDQGWEKEGRSPTIGFLVYRENAFCLVRDTNIGAWSLKEWTHAEIIEVIGNIHENPELLQNQD